MNCSGNKPACEKEAVRGCRPDVWRERGIALRAALQNRLHTCRHIRTVEDRCGHCGGTLSAKNVAGYVIVLNRRRHTPPPPLEDRIRHVYDILKSTLAPGEGLRCRDRMFVVTAKDYELSFTIEAYNKNACLVGHMDQGIPEVQLLRRMNTGYAMRRARDRFPQCLRQSSIWRRMGLFNLVNRYPNPADRFVASVKLEQELERMDLGIFYDAPGQSYGKGVILHAVHSPASRREEIDRTDCLYIRKDAFSFLAPFICRHVSHGVTTDNITTPLMYAVWEKIVCDLRRAAWLVLHDTFSEELACHFPDFCLYLLQRAADAPLGENAPRRLVYLHRRRLRALYHFVIDWLEAHALIQGRNTVISISCL